jgi:WD40 repeat protein
LAVSEDMRAQAESSARVARANEALVRENIYVADMRIAQQMRRDGDLTSLAGILDRYANDDQRGFEWRYLNRFRDVVRLTLQAHEHDIDGLAFSASGDVLATTCLKDGTVRVWNAMSGGPLGSYQVRTSTPRRWQEKLSALSPDGRRIAVLTDMRTLVVYDVETRSELARYDHQHSINTLAFLADSRLVVIGADDETLVWEYETAAVVQRCPGARLVAVCPDGRQLGLADRPSWSSSLRLFDIPTTAAVRDFPQPAPVHDIAYSHDGTKVAVLGDGRPFSTIHIRNPYSSQLLWAEGGRPGEHYDQIGFSGDDRWLAASATDGRLRLWDARSGQSDSALRGPATRMTQFAFSAGQPWLATALPGGKVLVWDQRLLVPCATLTPEREVTGPLRFAPDGETLAVATPDRHVLLIDRAMRSVRLKLPRHDRRVLDLAFSPSGKQLVTTDGEFVYCWNCHDGQRQWATPVTFAVCLDWSPRQNLIAWAGATRSIGLLDAEHGSKLDATMVQPNEVLGLRFLPDGERLVSVSADGTIRLWNAVSDKAVGEPLSAEAPLHQVAVSAGGKLIAAVGRRLWVWRLNDDNSLNELPIHHVWAGNYPNSFAFSPDGKTLGLGGSTGLFRAVDTETGKLHFTFSGRRIGAASVAYDPGGNDLATISPEGCLNFWNLSQWKTQSLAGSPLSAVTSLAFSPDGSTLAIGTDDSVTSGRPASSETDDEPAIRGLSKGNLSNVATATAGEVDARPWDSSGPGFRLWDVASEREQPALGQCVSATAIPLVAWSRSGFVAAGSHDGTVWIWNSHEKRLVTRFAVNPDCEKVIGWRAEDGQPISRQTIKELDGIAALTFSVDGGTLAVATRQGIIQVINTNDWEHRRTLTSDAAAVSCLAFAPSGSMLVANRGGQLLCWQLATGPDFRVHHVGESSDSRIISAAFSRTGRLFAMGREDGVVELFDGSFANGDDVITSAKRHMLKGHVDRVASLCFSSDDRTLVSGSWDTTVRLWHTVSGQELGMLDAHHGKIEVVAFSPDGNVLATGGQRDADHGEVLLWRTNPFDY